MKFYELTVILNSTLEESVILAEIDKIEKKITSSGGKIHKLDRWGTRRLAYLINGLRQGHYVHFLFEAPSTLLAEMEKIMRINENILRNLAILVQAPPPEPKKEAEGIDEKASTDEPSPIKE